MTRPEALKKYEKQIRRYGSIIVPGIGELTVNDLTAVERRENKAIETAAINKKARRK